jgi:hypothetical protein
MPDTDLLIPKQIESTGAAGADALSHPLANRVDSQSGQTGLLTQSSVFSGGQTTLRGDAQNIGVHRTTDAPKTLGRADNFGPHLDASDAYFLRQELEFMLNREITTEYPEKKARRVFPINTQGGWAQEISYTAYDRVGRARIVTCANDWPRVSLGGVCKWTSPVVNIGSGFEICFEDIQAARYANKPLESRLMGAVREAIMEEENRLVWYGDSASALLGIANNPYIPRQVAAFPIDCTSTADQILKVLHTAANYAIVATLGAGQPPDTMLLPISIWTYLSSTYLNTGNSSNVTILQAFLQTNQFISKIDWIPELETLGVGGTRAIFFYHSDPRSIEIRLPVDFLALPAFWNGLSTEINFMERYGGMWLYYPARALLLEGV